MSDPTSTITLRAIAGAPLRDARVRRIVEATARAIAERHSVGLLSMQTTDDRVTVTLAAHRLAAIGFIAELRRLTTAWYRVERPEESLWGEPAAHSDEDNNDPADWWKNA